MSLPRTSKELSARVDWGYFRRKSPLESTRTWAWLGVGALAALPVVFAFGVAPAGSPQPWIDQGASRGQLASPHAAWDQQCEACHAPFDPIRSDRWLPDLLGTGAPGHTVAARCEGCHAGPAHHANVANVPLVAQGCANCHRDHRGRDVSLNKMADSTCTVCHTDMSRHVQDPKAVVYGAKVTGFGEPNGHPEFRALTEAGKKARTLKFSHATHMAPGFAVNWDSARIEDPAERQHWAAWDKDAGGKKLTQLDCAACHQLEGTKAFTPPGEATALHSPSRAGGAYYLPVNFDAHCRACHPLKFDDRDAAMRDVQVPHRAQPPELRAFLTRVYSARQLDDRPEPTPREARNDRLDPLPPLTGEARKKAQSQAAEKVEKALATLLTTRKACIECHTPDYAPAGGVPSADSTLPVAVKAASVPTVLQPHARFDHTAHRAMECQNCHAGSYRDKAAELKAAKDYWPAGVEDVQYQHPPDLVSVKSCQECHAPASVVNGEPRGGVRANCVDCHNYHNGDHALAGPGAPERGAKRKAAKTADLLRAVLATGEK